MKEIFFKKFSIPYSSFYNIDIPWLKNNKINPSNTNIAAESDVIDNAILEIIKNWVEHPQYQLTLDKIRLQINDVARISINN